MHSTPSSLNACRRTLAKDKPASRAGTSSSTLDASQELASLRSLDLLTKHSQHNETSSRDRARESEENSEQLAVTPLLPLRRHHSSTRATTPSTTIPHRRFRFRAVVLTPYRDIDRRLEDIVHAAHFLGRAFHVEGAHFLRDGFTLGLRDGG